MEKKKYELNKRILALCIGLIITGSIICGIGFGLVDFNIYKLNPEPASETISKNKTIAKQEIDAITMDVSHANVTIERIEGDQFQLQYEEKEDNPIKVETNNNTLSMYQKDKVKILHFGWMEFQDNNTLNIKFQVPSNYVGDLSVATSYGTLKIDDITGINKLSIENEHGDMTVSNMAVSQLSLTNAYGTIQASDIKSNEALTIENEHDDINLKNIEASTISVMSSYGAITANHLITQQDILLENEHGSVDLNDVQARNFESTTAYCGVTIDTMKLEDKILISNEHEDITLTNIQSKQSRIEVLYGEVTLKSWLSDMITMEVEHGNITSTILGEEDDYHILTDVEHGENSLANERNKDKTKKLNVTLSYGDLDVKFIKF